MRLGNRRVTGKEQYYTPEDLALRLTAEVVAVAGPLNGRTVLEPAGGTGAFIKAAKTHGAGAFVSFDIDPKFEGVRKGDFLAAKLRLPHDAVAISNPPFGRNNSLSIPFFNKAADHAQYIAFIVPRSWRKWSVLNRLDRRFELVADHDIQIDYVDDRGQHINKQLRLRTCFQIWQRQEAVRPAIVVPDNGLIQKSSPEEAQLAIRVFGYGCGKVLSDFPPQKNTTLMFLKTKDPSVQKLLPELDYQRFSKNTAYTEALAFTEINFLLNEKVFGSGLHQEKVR